MNRPQHRAGSAQVDTYGTVVDKQLLIHIDKLMHTTMDHDISRIGTHFLNFPSSSGSGPFQLYSGNPDLDPSPADIHDGPAVADSATFDAYSGFNGLIQQIMANILRILDQLFSSSSHINPLSGFPPTQFMATPGAGLPPPTPSSSAGSYTSTGDPFNPGPNQPLARWKDGIDKAAYVTGLDPNLIGGQMWAESRGNPNDPSRNHDGTTDLGLMQISQERWIRDVAPNLTPEERARVKEATGKEPEQLDMRDPNDNIIGGSLELTRWIREKGSVEQGLHFYVSGGDPSIGSRTYVQDVLRFRDILASGGKLPD